MKQEIRNQNLTPELETYLNTSGICFNLMYRKWHANKINNDILPKGLNPSSWEPTASKPRMTNTPSCSYFNLARHVPPPPFFRERVNRTQRKWRVSFWNVCQNSCYPNNVTVTETYTLLITAISSQWQISKLISRRASSSINSRWHALMNIPVAENWPQVNRPSPADGLGHQTDAWYRVLAHIQPSCS
jgi:hypothetical protein